jgi:plasmid stabilization system protein ParE
VIGYRLLLAADEEMNDAAGFYEAAASGLGGDFLDDVQHAIDAARDMPGLGPLVQDDFRRILLRRFPFSIIYALDSNSIVVVAIAHQRRRPGYWKGRQ